MLSCPHQRHRLLPDKDDVRDEHKDRQQILEILKVWFRQQFLKLRHPESIAVAADGHQMAVVDGAVDQRRRHHVVAEDLAPVLKALVRREELDFVLSLGSRPRTGGWRNKGD
jgi:hypothetical protein